MHLKHISVSNTLIVYSDYYEVGCLCVCVYIIMMMILDDQTLVLSQVVMYIANSYQYSHIYGRDLEELVHTGH